MTNRFVYLTSGLAILSLPHSSTTATIKGGANGLILATDTKDISDEGHTTTYTSDAVTVGVSIPLDLKEGEVVEHVVLHEGACVGDELTVGA